jgi:hypothetical protein
METFLQILTGLMIGGCTLSLTAVIWCLIARNGKAVYFLKWFGGSFLGLLVIITIVVMAGYAEPEEESKTAATEEIEEEEETAEDPREISVDVEPAITTQDDSITLSGETEADVKVTITQDGKTLKELTTDDSGEFSLPVTLAGEQVYFYDFRFEKEGFKTTERTTVVTRVLTKEEQTAQSKEKAKTIDYKQLEKNPDRMKGEYVTFQGEIVQILEEGESTEMRVAVTKESWGWSSSDIVYVGYAGLTDYVEGDVITFYGEVYGSVQYTSQAGWEISVPAVIADVIE